MKALPRCSSAAEAEGVGWWEAEAHGWGGCAGWGAGQLEYELTENSWLTVPADADLLFATPLEGRWQAAAGRIGVDMMQVADYSGHA